MFRPVLCIIREKSYTTLRITAGFTFVSHMH